MFLTIPLLKTVLVAGKIYSKESDVIENIKDKSAPNLELHYQSGFERKFDWKDISIMPKVVAVDTAAGICPCVILNIFFLNRL